VVDIADEDDDSAGQRLRQVIGDAREVLSYVLGVIICDRLCETPQTTVAHVVLMHACLHELGVIAVVPRKAASPDRDHDYSDWQRLIAVTWHGHIREAE